MKLFKKFSVKLDRKTFIFYNEIAKITNKPIEDVLSNILYKYAENIVKEIDKINRNGNK